MPLSRLLLPELSSAFALAAAIVVLAVEGQLLAGGAGLSFAIFAILLVAIVAVSVRVARHAEQLAHRRHDPFRAFRSVRHADTRGFLTKSERSARKNAGLEDSGNDHLNCMGKGHIVQASS